MRTARFSGRLFVGGGGGVFAQRGVSQGECLPPPPRGQTDPCENITLPQTSFTGGKNQNEDICNSWFMSLQVL